jgi:ABC-type multidrug transport system ATPase subunit
LISARGVSRRYGGDVALHPTDFDLRAGELVALVGPNGAGKSTLLAILAGALEPSSGTVRRERDVAWAPQRPAAYARLTPHENVELFARLGRTAPEPVALPDRPVGDLSVGQRQQLNLVLAFLGSPRVALLDEPTASLDPDRREELWRAVDRLRADGGAVAFATQALDEAARADRVVRLEHGRVV